MPVRNLVTAALGVLAVSAAIALAVLHFAGRPRSDEDAARVLLESGRAAEAEAIDARILERDPTVPHALALAQAHAGARAAKIKWKTNHDSSTPAPAEAMSREALAAIVASLPPDVGLLARYALGFEDARDAVFVAATRDPPMPWANHVIAVMDRAEGDELAAAERFWREGTAFPERKADLDEALRCWISVGAWEEARDHAANGASPGVRYELAVHDRDWRGALRVLPATYVRRFDARFLWLAIVAAIAWAFFCARLGKLGERPALRASLYLVAFVLGVLSVAPTLALIAIEEAKLHLVDTGDVARDLLFFVFGVGLREEASKLLLFAALLPALRKWGNKLDVLVCGAMVGLGFAAEENLSYLASENLHTGLGRFLTANFLHMAMTGILASALDDFARDREKYAQDFLRASLMVVGLHGAYDFLIAHEEMGGGYVAMGVFVVLTKLFLETVERARGRADRGLPLMHAFVLALAVVTGASFAHAVDAVGVKQGLLVMGEGVLGEGIMIIVFGRFLATI